MKKQTIVLAGMPGIEWASENLTGHGGTEVNGNWYYTWNQAMAAAAEVGNGWRLPTEEEHAKLCDLDSAWDYKRHARDFGCGLILEAYGWKKSPTTKPGYVGSKGVYWVDSTHRYGDTMYADAILIKKGVYPAINMQAHYSASVRLVRDMK